MLRGVARHARYPLHSPVAPSLPLLRIAVCRVILIVLYHRISGAIGEVSYKPMSLQPGSTAHIK
jgi:hypothetical protein